MFDRVTQTILVLPETAGAGDGWDDPGPTYGDPIQLYDAVTAPADTSESTKPGYENRVITGLTLFWTDDVKIGPHDRVEVDGVAYQVIGEAGDYRNFSFASWSPGQQIALKRVAG